MIVETSYSDNSDKEDNSAPKQEKNNQQVQDIKEALNYLTDITNTTERQQFNKKQNQYLQIIQLHLKKLTLDIFSMKHLCEYLVNLTKSLDVHYLNNQNDPYIQLGMLKAYHVYTQLHNLYSQAILDSDNKKQKKEEDKDDDNDQIENINPQSFDACKSYLLKCFKDYLFNFIEIWFQQSEFDDNKLPVYEEYNELLILIIQDICSTKSEHIIQFDDSEKYEIFDTVLSRVLGSQDNQILYIKDLCNLIVYFYTISKLDRERFNERLIQIIKLNYKTLARQSQNLIVSHGGIKIHPVLYIIMKGIQQQFTESQILTNNKKNKIKAIKQLEDNIDEVQNLFREICKQCMQSEKSQKLKDFLKLLVTNICDSLYSPEFPVSKQLLDVMLEQVNQDYLSALKKSKKMFDKGFIIELATLIAKKVCDLIISNEDKIEEYTVKKYLKISKNSESKCSFCESTNIQYSIFQNNISKYQICQLCAFNTPVIKVNEQKSLKDVLEDEANIFLLSLIIGYFDYLQINTNNKHLQFAQNMHQVQVHQFQKLLKNVNKLQELVQQREQHMLNYNLQLQDNQLSFILMLYENFVYNSAMLEELFKKAKDILIVSTNDPALSFRKKGLTSLESISLTLIDRPNFQQTIVNLVKLMQNRTADKQPQLRDKASGQLLQLVVKLYKQCNFEDQLSNNTSDEEMEDIFINDNCAINLKQCLNDIIICIKDEETYIRKKILFEIFKYSEELLEILAFYPSLKIKLFDLLVDKKYSKEDSEEVQIISMLIMCEMVFQAYFDKKQLKLGLNNKKQIYKKLKFPKLNYNNIQIIKRFHINLQKIFRQSKFTGFKQIIPKIFKTFMQVEQRIYQGENYDKKDQNYESKSVKPFLEQVVKYSLNEINKKIEINESTNIKLKIAFTCAKICPSSAIGEVQRFRQILQEGYCQKQQIIKNFQYLDPITRKKQEDQIEAFLIYTMEIFRMSLQENTLLISQSVQKQFQPIEDLLKSIIYDESKQVTYVSLQLLSEIVKSCTGNVEVIKKMFSNCYKLQLELQHHFMTLNNLFCNQRKDIFLIRTLIIICQLAINNYEILFSDNQENKDDNSLNSYQSINEDDDQQSLNDNNQNNQNNNDDQISFTDVFSQFLYYMRLNIKHPDLSQKMKEVCKQLQNNSLECLTELWKKNHELILQCDDLIIDLLDSYETEWQQVCLIFKIFESFLDKHRENILKQQKSLEKETEDRRNKRDKIKMRKQKKDTEFFDNEPIQNEQLYHLEKNQSMEEIVCMILDFVKEYYHIHIHRKSKSLKLQILSTINKICELGIATFQSFGENIIPLVSDINEAVVQQTYNFIKKDWNNNYKPISQSLQDGMLKTLSVVEVRRQSNVAYDFNTKVSYFKEFSNIIHNYIHKQNNNEYIKSFELRIMDMLSKWQSDFTYESFKEVKFLCSILLSQQIFDPEDYKMIILGFKNLIDIQKYEINQNLKEALKQEFIAEPTQYYEVMTLVCLIYTVYLLLLGSPYDREDYDDSLDNLLQKIKKSKKILFTVNTKEKATKKNKSKGKDEEEEELEEKDKMVQLPETNYEVLKEFDRLLEQECDDMQWDMIFISDFYTKKIKDKIKSLIYGPFQNDPFSILDPEFSKETMKITKSSQKQENIKDFSDNEEKQDSDSEEDFKPKKQSNKKKAPAKKKKKKKKNTKQKQSIDEKKILKSRTRQNKRRGGKQIISYAEEDSEDEGNEDDEL